ncbi:hypothetical protein AWB71_02557 [Caballeronia peredens]|nr:hypothetical protein AWB71_02557 [Caballeronia peredens]
MDDKKEIDAARKAFFDRAKTNGTSEFLEEGKTNAAPNRDDMKGQQKKEAGNERASEVANVYRLLSDQDNIKVFEHSDGRSRMIDLPNRYEVHARFAAPWRPKNAPDAAPQPFGVQLKHDDIAFGRTQYLVFKDRLQTDEQVKEFDFKVLDARKLNASYDRELDAMKKFYTENAPEGKPASFAYGRPSHDKKPLSYINETVLERGEHFTLVTSPSREDASRYRFIENHRFLQGADEFKAENRNRILEERLPIGEKLHFAFEGNKIKVSPYRANELNQSANVDPAKASEERFTKHSQEAYAAADRKASSFDIKMKAQQAGKSYLLMLKDMGHAPEDGATVVLPKEVAVRPAVAEGFKAGFRDLYSKLFQDNTKDLTFEAPAEPVKAQEQKLEKTPRKSKAKTQELAQ